MPRNRFHDGCWTCKAKRFQCDRTRPHCLMCTQKGFKCEGYEMRLKWGTGIASRGRFAGASQPVETAIPPRPKGRHRDLLREERRREAAVRASSSQPHAACPVVSSDSESNISTPPAHSATASPTAHQDDNNAEQEVAHRAVNTQPRLIVIPPWISRQGEEEIGLFKDFVTYGINTLASTSVNDEDNMLIKHLPSVSQQSDAFCAICITIQAQLSGRPDSQQLIYKYFDMALSSFRAELGDCQKPLNDGTFTAGLMISTLRLSQGAPWTLHLHGMYNVLLTQGLREPLNDHTPYRRHLLEVMGYLDLPGFAVGRLNSSLGVWRRHCREPGYLCRPPQLDSVEFVSGLPRSLLDLLSAIDGTEISEEDLWDWPGAPGSLTQCHLWEAYRLAAILSLRNPRLYTPAQTTGELSSASPSVDGSSQASSASRKAVPASTDVVATRIISHIDAITCAYLLPDSIGDSLLFNAIDYPLFVAGMEADVMNGNPGLKAAIKKCFAVRAEAFKYPSRGMVLLDIMEEWWTCAREDSSINDLATSRHLELGLL
ncbi:hypothetical protein E4U42_002630 [Claviceps africana]|uniref:Zn(2)-C6 fungal-type domain-containing protein n=1 Tax=Claviceps africana TaxID=83212 RepID=A0A8K0NJK2_9HYPO|nr:hypothetical protein E4U42_002630 [Claviceps africana]